MAENNVNIENGNGISEKPKAKKANNVNNVSGEMAINGVMSAQQWRR
jgi:hypothetical protein